MTTQEARYLGIRLLGLYLGTLSVQYFGFMLNQAMSNTRWDESLFTNGFALSLMPFLMTATLTVALLGFTPRIVKRLFPECDTEATASAAEVQSILVRVLGLFCGAAALVGLASSIVVLFSDMDSSAKNFSGSVLYVGASFALGGLMITLTPAFTYAIFGTRRSSPAHLTPWNPGNVWFWVSGAALIIVLKALPGLAMGLIQIVDASRFGPNSMIEMFGVRAAIGIAVLVFIRLAGRVTPPNATTENL